MFDNLLQKFKQHPQTTTQAPHKALTVPTERVWQPGDTILDRYLVQEIFSGAMGRVFIAEHQGWRVKMAIKVPKSEILAHKEGIKRILTEANSWVKMGMHPNIATCYYVLTIDQTPYIFIEYVDGGDLSIWLKTGRCREIRTALTLAIQFCHGMEFTHSHGIIHRDIKPGNILISKDAFLKITDFGIIHTLEGKAPGLPLAAGESETTVGFRGTPSYASPEQFKDSHNIDQRSDIFSFGICLWLMLCGHRPYRHNSSPLQAEPTPLDPQTVFPPVLTELLTKVIAPAPNDRQQSFAELRQELNQAYISYFKVPCPYMDLDVSALEADNLNNRAASFFELGKTTLGERCLKKALDKDDTHTEAIFNYTLFKWRQGIASPKRLLKQLEASKKRTPEAQMLNTLSQAVKCALNKETWESDSGHPVKDYFPEYLLCRPKNSATIFQQSQLRNSVKSNISDLVSAKKYSECNKILFDLWRNDRFKKDILFLKTYEKLQKAGRKTTPAWVLRLKTNQLDDHELRKMFYLPGPPAEICNLRESALTFHPLTARAKNNLAKNFAASKVVTISPNGRYLALGSPDNTAIIWDNTSKKRLSNIVANCGISALSLKADSSKLLVGSDDGSIKQYLLPDKIDRPFITKNNSSKITSICQFTKGDDYITGSKDGSIRYWQGQEKEPIRIIKAHTRPVTILEPVPDGLLFISGEDGPELKVWDRQTGRCIRTIIPHDGLPFSLICLADGKRFITASEDDMIKMWDITSVESIFTLDGRGNGITSLCQGPYPHIFLSGGQDGSLIFWMIIYELDFS